MTVLATLAAMSISAAEEAYAAGQLATGAGFGGNAYADAAGTISGAYSDIARLKDRLNQLVSVLPPAQSVTFTNSSANITGTNLTSYFTLGQQVQFTGTVPTNFATATSYYIVSLTATTMTVSATAGGAAIVAGSAGTAPWTAVGANRVNLAATVTSLA